VLPPKRELAWFLIRLAGLLGLFMYPWPGAGHAYGRAAGALGNILLGDPSSHPAALLHFDAPTDAPDASAGDEYATELRAFSRTTGEALTVPIDLRTLTYVPSAVFVALTLASTIWVGLRGITVLLAGLALLHAFLLISLVVPLLLFFADPQPMQLLELSTPLRWIMNIFYRSLVAPPGMIYAVPALIWLLMLWIVPRPQKHRAQPSTVLNA
jgi:hypothetical protein